MFSKEQELLSSVYQNYLETGKRECGLTFSNLQDKSETYDILDNLRDDGFIEYTARAMGFCQFKITTYGIQFSKNGFKELELSPSIQGDNNIVISGSSNTVSGNYNSIWVDIANYDLPEDSKKIIESFLYEMRNPHLTPDKKESKINSFLSDISSGTISGIAASGISALLAAILNQLHF